MRRNTHLLAVVCLAVVISTVGLMAGLLQRPASRALSAVPANGTGKAEKGKKEMSTDKALAGPLKTLADGKSVCASDLSADESKETMRPISEADSVLAVYREDWGRASSGKPSIILVVWPEGHIVWSGDRLKGGAPYRAGRVNPKKVAALLARFNKEGLFADEKLNQAHFGPDSEFITVFIKSGKNQVKMQSWHELMEASDKLVADHAGARTLEGRRRLEVLRKTPAEYLFFRFVWSETRSKVSQLIPTEGRASAGRPVMRAGVLSWREPAAKPQQG